MTRSILFSLKCTRNCLAAGLCLDPLGELEHSPRPHSHIRGLGPPERGRERKVEKRPTLREGGNGKGGNGKGKEGREKAYF